MPISFVIQGFNKQGRRLVPDQPSKALNADDAINGARRLAERRAGVVAYSIEVDSEVDYWGDPTILYKTGEVPSEFDEA